MADEIRTTLSCGMSDEEQIRISRACNPITMVPETTRAGIKPAEHDPVPFGDFQRAIRQISAALRPHGLILVTNILDGSFSVEKDHA